MYPEQNLSRIPNPVSKVAESKISKSYSPKHKYTPSLIELVVGTLKEMKLRSRRIPRRERSSANQEVDLLRLPPARTFVFLINAKSRVLIGLEVYKRNYIR